MDSHPEDQLRKNMKAYQTKKRKREEEEKKASEGINMTEPELQDQISRNKKAVRLLLTLLPKLDDADRRRMDRASKTED